MRPRWLAIVLAVAPAVMGCARGGGAVATLHREAVALVAYYRPIVDRLEARLRDLNLRGPKLHQRLPGSDAANDHRRVAERRLAALRQRVGATAGAGQLLREADVLERAGDAAALGRLVDRNRETLAEEVATIHGELRETERWLVGAEAIVRSPRPPRPAMLAP